MKQSVHFIRVLMLFWQIDRLASNDVTLQLIKTKCIPIFLYDLEACPVTKSQLSIDFDINRLFMNLLQTSNIDTVNYCRQMFYFDLPSIMLACRTENFMHV